MAMRSAIHYPDTHLKSKRSMASALLLWDELKVITPWQGFGIQYHAADMAEAWELIGKPLVPSEDAKAIAHNNIQTLIDTGGLPQINSADDLRPDREYEMFSQKLSHETWRLLVRNQVAPASADSHGFIMKQQAGMAIMAKLADACAGEVYARVTDRMLAYGLIADRDEEVMAHSHVVPVTLDLIDAGSITLETLIDFRAREVRERNGRDFRAWRHNYADAIQEHVLQLCDVESSDHREELTRQFREEMERHLSELKQAIGKARLEFVLKPAVVSVAVGVSTGVGGFLIAGPAGAVAGVAAGSAIKGIADIFAAGIGFSEKQRKAMEKNPMAYMYQLARA